MTFCRGNYSASRQNLNGMDTIEGLLALKVVSGDLKLFLAPRMQKD